MPLQEVGPDNRCSNCSNPTVNIGLAPGEHLQEERSSGSLGEIGSWQPGMPDQRYRTAYDPLPPGDAGTSPSTSLIAESTAEPAYNPPLTSPDADPVGGPGSEAASADYDSYGPRESYDRPGSHDLGTPAYGRRPNNPTAVPAGQERWTGDHVPIPQPGGRGPGGYGSGAYGPPNTNPPYDPNVVPDPDRPPWGVLESLGVWIFSVVAIVLVPTIVLTVWVVVQQGLGVNIPRENLQHNPTVVFIGIVAEGVAHLLTIAVLWAVITRMGQRPFWATLGSRWSDVPSSAKYGLVLGAAFLLFVIRDVWSSVPAQWRSVLILAIVIPIGILLMARLRPAAWSKIGFVIGVVVLSLILDIILSNFLPQSKGTEFEEMLKASLDVRVLISALAILTAPLVEEGVYRGVLYSALRRVMGLVPSVIVVTVLFAGVHVPQYWGAWTNIASITILSLFLTVVRAKSKSIIPCIAIHTLYNVINSIFILAHKY
jgi:membrane protease YdiL (CAAX protease family)